MSYDPSKWTSYSAPREDVWRSEDRFAPDTDNEWRRKPPGEQSYAYSGPSGSNYTGPELSEEVLRTIKLDLDDGLLETLRRNELGNLQQPMTATSETTYDADGAANDAGIDTTQPVEDCMDIELQKTHLLAITEQLADIVAKLPSAHRKKIDNPVVARLAVSLMDGTVFEIVKGLEDIQQLKERNLLNRRVKVLAEQKAEKANVSKRHQAKLQECGSKAHQIAMVTKHQEAEWEKLERKMRHELQHLDQKLVLELDQQVSDQQATLQRAGIPLFFVTNNPEDIKLQMALLEVISHLME